MKIKVYAKLNLALNITGIKSGMHLIDTVMGSVSLFDELDVFEADKISVSCDMEINGKNIAMTAAEKVYEICGRSLGVHIKKGIPVGGGMGGSSADGAGVLIAANKLFGLDKLTDINALALSLGADVPYMLSGGFCRAQGFGEMLSSFTANCGGEFLIAECGAVSTKDCYKLSDSLCNPSADIDGVIRGIKGGRLEGLSNALTEAAVVLNPKIGEGLEVFNQSGIAAFMTGSGGCIFGRYNEQAKALLEQKGFVCHKAVFVSGNTIL